MKRVMISISYELEQRLEQLRREMPALRSRTAAIIHAVDTGLAGLGYGRSEPEPPERDDEAGQD